MAQTPPHAAPSRAVPRALRPSVGSALALAILAALWPADNAHAERSCDEWSVNITTLEGRLEVRRRGSQQWAALAAGERGCSGDVLRTEPSSRTLITLPDGGTLRLDENSTLALPEPPGGKGSLIELIRGLIHVISRDPRSLVFTTPYANAGLEGTEFDIRVDAEQRFTEVIVLEGEVVVSTPAGSLNVTDDHVAVAQEGRTPTASPYAAPIERMRWASYYPPVMDRALPAPTQEPTPAQQNVADFFAERAASRLATARVATAEADLDRALAIDPQNAPALSLRALLALSRADRSAARDLLERALAGDPQSVVARIVLSHLEQSLLQLAAAETALREALALEPDNGIAATRLAEIALAQGDTRAAVAMATRARALAPADSAPLVVLGFAHLRAFDAAAAATAFAAAADLEPAAPLPRLGLGIASLQNGDRVEGRTQLELAVALDPANPLTRSYMARVYDAENRSDLTDSQLALAKDLDRLDPTPWLYSSLYNLRTNRPIEALQELRMAAQNAGRPALRSTLLLDDDVATRSLGLGRVHNELGFGRLALLDAWRAIGDDPTDFAARRLLADGYASQPLHETARVSELLLAQLLQPANVTPIKPQLTQPNSFIAQRAGPSSPSFDELASPVISNGLKLRVSGVSGTNGVIGDDVTAAGLHDKLSYNVGHYRFATDGVRSNNDLDQRTATGLLQYRPGHDSMLQAELRSSRAEYGDLATYFNPALNSSLLRGSEDADSLRIGGKHRVARNHLLLGSLIVQDVLSSAATAGLISLQSDQQGQSVDVQDIARFGNVTMQSGLVLAHSDESLSTTVVFPGLPPLAEQTEEASRQLGFYSYATFAPTPRLSVTAGASLYSIDIGSAKDEAANPKLGLVWRPTRQTTIRAAAFRTLFNDLTTSPYNAQPRLEPTQVAGFTQLVLGARGDEATVGGIAIDHELSRNLFVGWQADNRRTYSIGLRSSDAGSERVDLKRREQSQQAYVYWTPLDTLSFSARASHQRWTSEPAEAFKYTHVRTDQLPFEVRYFWRSGFTAGGTLTRVHQSGTFQTEPVLAAPVSPGDDRFWLMDAFIGYRLPNRRGLLSLNADNLLDESFQFQDINPTNPSLFPERLVSLRFTLAFD